MFGGQFNAANMGKVLTIYSEARNKVVSKYLGYMHKEIEKMAKTRHDQQLKENWIPELIKGVQKFREDQKHWSLIPEYWWTIYKRKWIEVDKESEAEILEQAREAAKEKKEELEREKVEARVMKIGNIVIPSDSSLTKRIAKQITIYQYAIMDDSWEALAMIDQQNKKY